MAVSSPSVRDPRCTCVFEKQLYPDRALAEVARCGLSPALGGVGLCRWFAYGGEEWLRDVGASRQVALGQMTRYGGVHAYTFAFAPTMTNCVPSDIAATCGIAPGGKQPRSFHAATTPRRGTLFGSERRFSERKGVSPTTQVVYPFIQAVPSAGHVAFP